MGTYELGGLGFNAVGLISMPNLWALATILGKKRFEYRAETLIHGTVPQTVDDSLSY